MSSQVKSNDHGNQKKKWQKATIILIPNQPPPPLQPRNSKFAKSKSKKQIYLNNVNEQNVAANTPLKLPRSKPEYAASAPKAERSFAEPDSPVKISRSARKASSSNSGGPLWDRNVSGRSEESVSKEPEVFEDRRRPRLKKTQEEKENSRR